MPHRNAFKKKKKKYGDLRHFNSSLLYPNPMEERNWLEMSFKHCLCVREPLCIWYKVITVFCFYFWYFFCVFFLLWVFYTLKIYVVLLLSWCGMYTLTIFFMFQSLFSAMDTPCFCHPYNCLWMVQKRGEGGWSPLPPPLTKHQYETNL